jgi:hypothetical protein
MEPLCDVNQRKFDRQVMTINKIFVQCITYVIDNKVGKLQSTTKF